jgi:hypothetical protein
MTETISTALRDAWGSFLLGVELLLPQILAALSIVVVGWLVAALLGVVVRYVLGWLKFNAFAQRTGASDLLKKAELPTANVVAGRLVFWLVWIGFLISGAETLGFSGMRELMTGFAGFLPRLGAALLILAVGFVVANFAWRATLLAAVNAQVRSARIVSGAVRFLVLVLAIAMALDQIAVARSVVVAAFAITFGAVMLGLAIALGIGGGPVAARVLDQLMQQAPRQDSDPAPHL